MKKKLLSLTLAWSMLCSIFAMPAQTAAAEVSDDDLEDIISIHTYLLGILTGAEAADINEDGCINAVDLTLAKRYLMGYVPPALEPLEADTCDICLNEEKNVTFTVQTVCITDPVTLYDQAGNVIAEMYDNGENGDEMPGDSIYTAQAVLSSDSIKNAGYYAVAGELRSEPFEICFYRDLEDEDFTNFFELEEQISGKSFEEAAEFIAGSDEIITYSIDEEQRQISFQCIYGFHCLYEDPEETDKSTFGTGLYAVPDDAGLDYVAAADTVASCTFVPAHPDKRDVILLRPTHGSDHPYENAKKTGEIIATALGGTLTVVDDENVTLEQMKQLDSYGVVLLSSHGHQSLFSNYIQVGESMNIHELVPDPIKKYSADYESGRIALILPTKENPDQSTVHFAVSKKFFQTYYKRGSLQDSFWYLGACFSLYTSGIANALISKGAGAVIGYTDTVYTEYYYSTLFEAVLNSMVLSGDTVYRGVSEAKRIYGYEDSENYDCTIDYRGDRHFRLTENIINSSGTYTSKGHKYKVYHIPVKWSQAKEYCEILGGHLATVTSGAEQQFIERIIGYYDNNYSDFYWLGATDEEEEGVWKWVTGEEFSYNNWSFGNPNNFDHDEYGFEHYLGITGKGYFFADPFQWNDFADATYDGVFDYKTGFICEWE